MKRIALLLPLLLLLLLAACSRAERIPLTPTAAAPPTSAPTETPVPPTPTETPTPTPPSVDVNVLFSAHPDFAKALISQDAKAGKNFIQKDDTYYLNVEGKAVEIDIASAGVNVDIYGQPLEVEGTGFPNPLTIHGVGESKGRVFAFAPKTEIYLADEQEKVIPAHWFEVIQPNKPVEGLTAKEQIEYDINHPVEVTVEQVQSGDWALSVILSGNVKPFPEYWKFTGNAITQYSPGEIDLRTSEKIPVNFFGVVDVGGVNIDLRPWQVWNPDNLEGWSQNDFSGSDKLNHHQVMIVSAGVGEENLTEQANAEYLLVILYGEPNHSDKNVQVNLITDVTQP